MFKESRTSGLEHSIDDFNGTFEQEVTTLHGLIPFMVQACLAPQLIMCPGRFWRPFGPSVTFTVFASSMGLSVSLPGMGVTPAEGMGVDPCG